MKSAETETVTLCAFGQKVALSTNSTMAGDVPRRLSELTEIYERTLASRVIPRSGLAIDLGAGAGWFAIPFAKAFPDWTVIAFEPDPSEHARLVQNAQAHGITNLQCMHACVHPDASVETKARQTAPLTTSPAQFVPIKGLEPRLAPASGHRSEGVSLTYPAIAPTALASLRPDLIKLDAPFSETALAHALKNTALHLIMGRVYAPMSSDSFSPAPEAGPRQYYLVRGNKALRRDFEDNFETRRSGLDIVVAMYNAKEHISECLDSVLADGNPQIHVMVVDDGSTDGSGVLVKDRYGHNPRVTLLSKHNGGCASARNYGRLNSHATHIAFVDADDRVEPALFTTLLETAQHTGAYVTEGEFEFLERSDSGAEDLRPSHEASVFATPGSDSIGVYDFVWVPGHQICMGRPTIWRRVHRRDFLDQRNIWFPEHVRAFDDQIFQILLGEYCGAIAHVRRVHYQYRQHPGQDVKQNDERHFYSFNMFRTLVIRSLDEGWQDTDPLCKALLNTLHWSHSMLREDLKDTYCEAAVRMLGAVSKAYGRHFTSDELASTGIGGLERMLGRYLSELGGDPVDFGLIRSDDWRWQPELIRMAARLQS
ncbi:MAG: FkbM family methyltransferase [Pseudomonadota bacterium]